MPLIDSGRRYIVPLSIFTRPLISHTAEQAFTKSMSEDGS